MTISDTDDAHYNGNAAPFEGSGGGDHGDADMTLNTAVDSTTSDAINSSRSGGVRRSANNSKRECRVYVGNLAYEVGWQDLKDFMRKGKKELCMFPPPHNMGSFAFFLSLYI